MKRSEEQEESQVSQVVLGYILRYITYLYHYFSCCVCIIYFYFFAYCYIIGQTPDDAKVFGEIYWEENDIILVLESRVGICLKTI